ncbi:glycoside hydrolase family 95-like protein, partial [Streptomyces sp. 2MCAF27]
FQIDGNFGATSGITEWLLQSHAGELHLLPALPPSLPNGRIHGLMARGGFEVDLTWSDATLADCRLHSRIGTRAVVRATIRLKVTAQGKPVQTDHPEPDLISFDTEPGVTYRLTPA